MKLSCPYKDADSKKIKNITKTTYKDHFTFDKYIKHSEKNKDGGYFPVGKNHLYHGGIHLREIGGKGKELPLRAIADGEVIAYRTFSKAGNEYKVDPKPPAKDIEENKTETKKKEGPEQNKYSAPNTSGKI